MLIAILILSSIGAFADSIATIVRLKHAKRAGYEDSPLYLFFGVSVSIAIVTLWWFYANSVGMMLLGLIPTVIFGISVLVGIIFAVAEEIG